MNEFLLKGLDQVHTQNNKYKTHFYNNGNHEDSREHSSNRYNNSVWGKFISICSQTIGGFYRPDGTIFREPHNSDSDSNIDFADLTQRTHQRLRHQETIRQINLEQITNLAYEKIDIGNAPKDVDPDWINLFFNYAQDISSRNMQELWAKAMALEISDPGTISKRSLTFLRNCDSWEIKAFRKVACSAFIAENGHPFIFKAKSHVSANDPIFSEHRLLFHCISAGLIAEDTTPVIAGFTFNYRGSCQVVQESPCSPGDSVGYYVQRFTRIGSDLYRLIVNTKEKAKKSEPQKQLVWDFLTDYLELTETA